MDKRLELKLYRAHCHADGCNEGKFGIECVDEFNVERHRRAMETVERYLRFDDTIVEKASGIADSEQEAQELARLC